MSSTELLLAGKIDQDLLMKRSLLFGMISKGLFAEKNNLLYVVLKTIQRYPGVSDNMLIFHLGRRFNYEESTIREMLKALQSEVTGVPPLVRERQNRAQSKRPNKLFYDINNATLLTEWITTLESENCALKLVNVVINDLENRKGQANV